MRTLSRMLVFVLFVCLSTAYGGASPLPDQQEYMPEKGKGRVVVVISGHAGTSTYQPYAKNLAEQGFYVILVDSNDFWQKEKGVGKDLLRGVITTAQQSPHALPGKAAVIGFSLGGGVALNFATKMPDLLSAVVLLYPFTSHINKPGAYVTKFEVPTLLLAGGRDTYENCCTIEKARELNDAAKAFDGNAKLQVVEYPSADHGFAIASRKTYIKSDADDALNKTIEYINKYMGK